MGWSFDRSVLAGIGLVVALLIADAALGYRNTRQLREDANWVAHTHAVLDVTGDVLGTVLDAETGQRGYLLTGKANFLEPYHKALARLHQQVATLKDMTRESAPQQARIRELEPLIAEQLAWLQKGIELRRRSAGDAQAFVATDQGKDKMDAIRRHIAAIEMEEHGLLRDRQREAAAVYHSAVITGLIAAGVGLALVAILVYLVRRSLVERSRAAALVHEERERLRTTLVSIGDAVIVTDAEGRVTLINQIAQDLTGWKAGAVGRALAEVFRIVNEQTRQPVESPVTRVMREGVIVGLANHTVLIARDGRDVPIDDSGAPIRNAEGAIIGVVLVFRDVSERRRLEGLQREFQAQLEQQVQERTAELRASEERFRLLVEGTHDYAIILLDPQGRVASWNPGAERINGYQAGEIVGQHFSRFYPQEAVERGWPAEELQRATTAGRFEDEGWRVRKDGSRFWANVILTALPGEAGKLRGFSKIVRDLTERKQAEENARRLVEEQAARRTAEEGQRQVRASEERLRLFVEHVPAAVAMFDRDMRYLLVSQRWLTDYGLEGRPVIGCQHYELFPHLPQRWKEVHRRCLAGAVERSEEDRFERADGGVDWLRWEVRPWRDSRGEVGGIMIFAELVTARKRAEQAAHFLADASKTLAALVDSGSTLQKVARLAVPLFADWCAVDLTQGDGSLQRVAIAHADPARIELARELARRHPPTPDAPLGAPHILRTGQPQLIPDITEAMLFDLVKDTELVRILRDLGLRSYLGVPLRAGGKTVGVMTFVRDETGRRFDATDQGVAEDLAHRASVAIENARLYAEVREADRRKDEFLAMLAHELRNPLAPIRNALYILKQAGTDAAVAARAREIMERQVQHMTRMVDDLLDVSRITRGKIELRKEPIDLTSVVERAVETIRPLIEDRQQTLTVDLPSEPLQLVADPTRLEQVLANLLNNAAKYTGQGGHVELSARQQGRDVVLRAKDTGVGIAPDMLGQIFEPFVQADRVLHHSQGGLGIGLTLVRRLVEMHGGTVTAQSEGPGKGSEFVVRLPGLVPRQPVAGPGAGPASSEPTQAARQQRILVVDDNVDAAESLAVLLQLEGHEVRVAYDGAAALAAVEADPPDVVFLDIGMPVMNGYEVARQLRQRPALRALVLVAVTGWGQEEDRRRSQQAGFDRHLVKPVEPEALHQLLARLR